MHFLLARVLGLFSLNREKSFHDQHSQEHHGQYLCLSVLNIVRELIEHRFGWRIQFIR